MEIWKPIRDFPSYDCSSEGRIRNIRTQIMPSTHIDNGYVKTHLQKNNRQYTVKVARVVAETFLGEHPGMDVRYKDNDRTNVCLDNLEWCTRSELISDAYKRGSKKPYQSIPIRVVETGDVYDSVKACAEHIPCSPSYIRQYFSGQRSNVKGFHFERLTFTP